MFDGSPHYPDLLDFLQALAPSEQLVYESTVLQARPENLDLTFFNQYFTATDLRELDTPISLQVVGPPGHGKVTLLKLLVQRLRQQRAKLIVLDVLNSLTIQSSLSLLRCLVHQMLSQRPSLFPRIRALYVERFKTMEWTSDALWAVVREFIRLCHGWRIVVVVSNFQKCPEDLQLVFGELDRTLSHLGCDYLFLSSSATTIPNICARQKQ
jgi:hypothetical protein